MTVTKGACQSCGEVRPLSQLTAFWRPGNTNPEDVHYVCSPGLGGLCFRRQVSVAEVHAIAPALALVPISCDDFRLHQSAHRLTPAGWTCDRCDPELAPGGPDPATPGPALPPEPLVSPRGRQSGTPGPTSDLLPRGAGPADVGGPRP